MANLLRVPNRYEDLDVAFRGRLRPNIRLNEIVKYAFQAMEMQGGIRFLPIFGSSGAGKTCATMELATHLPEVKVVSLDRNDISSRESLFLRIDREKRLDPSVPVIAVIDQFEEAVATLENIPTTFVETLSLLDRGELRRSPTLFIWLTTSTEFQSLLVDATRRNRRLLLMHDFEIKGPEKNEWPSIIDETFAAHNLDQPLSDYQVLEGDIVDISHDVETIGDALTSITEMISDHTRQLQDISEYQVVMVWPVTDLARIVRIQQFTDPRQGYKVDWSAFYRHLSKKDKDTLQLHELNRARLYFDLRLVPIPAADLYPICQNLDAKEFNIQKSYREHIRGTHLFSILNGTWDPEKYSPLRERDSRRAESAREWYPSVTKQPTAIAKRLAQCLTELGLHSAIEQDITTNYSSVRADILTKRSGATQDKVLIELKCYSPSNTMASTICSQIRTTLKRHAQLAGFMRRA